MPMRQSKYVCFTQTFIPQVYDKLNPILYGAGASRGLKVQFKLSLSLVVYIAMYICMHGNILIPWI